MRKVMVPIWMVICAIAFTLIIFGVFNIFTEILGPHRLPIIQTSFGCLVIGMLTLWSFNETIGELRLLMIIIWVGLFIAGFIVFLIGMFGGYDNIPIDYRDLTLQISFVSMALGLTTLIGLSEI